MPHILPIGGSKGGTGKSFISSNLGIALASRGKRTVMVDLDLGASNLHTMIGMAFPTLSLSDFISKRVANLEEAVTSTPIPDLFVVSGARNDLGVANISYGQKRRVIRGISTLPFDYVILDLGAGTSFNTIDFFMVSNTGLFVVIPEPTSIENVYRLARSLCLRMIRRQVGISDFRVILQEARARDPEGRLDYLENILKVFEDLFPEKEDLFEKSLNNMEHKLVMNQLRDSDNPELGRLICRVIEKHLGIPVEFLGNVSYNSRVHDSVCSRVPYINKYSYTQTTTDIRRLSDNIIEMNGGRKARGISR